MTRWAALLCVLAVLGVGAQQATSRLRSPETSFPPGLVAGPVPLGGLDSSHARDALEEYRRTLARVVRVRVGTQELALPPLEALLDAEATLDAAEAARAGESPARRMRRRLGLDVAPLPALPLAPTFDLAPVRAALEAWASTVRVDPFEGAVVPSKPSAADGSRSDGSRSDGSGADPASLVTTSPPRAGLELDVEGSLRALEALLARTALYAGPDTGPDTGPDAEVLDLPTRTLPPATTPERFADLVKAATHVLQGPVELAPAPDALAALQETPKKRPPAPGARKPGAAEPGASEPGASKQTAPPPPDLVVSREELASALHTHVGASGRLELDLAPERLAAPLRRARALLTQPAREARFVIDPGDRVRIEPSQVGTVIPAEAYARAVLAAAQAPERRGTLPLREGTKPTLSTEQAKALGIRRLVARFETRHACCQNRVENIHRIADLVNGVIVKPGDRLSINELVGPRTEARGFLMAPSVVEGQTVDTPGGGVSQFATTLYNAVLDAGYALLERKPHSLYFSRYPVGHEATLSFPKPDLIFRNDSQAGVLIHVEYGPTFVRVKLFGDNGGRKVKKAVSKKFDLVKPRIEYVADDARTPGKPKVKEPGSYGFSVITTRVVTFADGTQREDKRTVVYRPRVRVLRVHPCDIPRGERGHTGKPCPTAEGETDSTFDPERENPPRDSTAEQGEPP